MKFIQPTDENALGKLQDVAQTMTLSELQRFCEGTMNALIVVQDTWRKRFPLEYEEWERQIGEEPPVTEPTR